MPADPYSLSVMEVGRTQTDELRLSLAPTPEAVRKALQRIAVWMNELALGEGVRGRAEIMVAEALNNVTEHAFAGHPEPESDTKAIRLALRRDASGLTVTLHDRGAPMPDLALPPGELPSTTEEIANLPEGGFGWFLIRQIATDLHYAREDGWNRLTLLFDTGEG